MCSASRRGSGALFEGQQEAFAGGAGGRRAGGWIVRGTVCCRSAVSVNGSGVFARGSQEGRRGTEWARGLRVVRGVYGEVGARTAA